jgi:hypothetical protein
MGARHPSFWKRLQLLALGLLLLGVFNLLPDLLDKIVTLAAAVLVLVFLGGTWWEERRARQADQSNSAAISPGDQS